MCELYAVGGLACFVKITPTPDTDLASTAIEQAIQAEIKESSKLGAAKRWEADSKQGDLFKGYEGPVKLDGGDPLQAESAASSEPTPASSAFRWRRWAMTPRRSCECASSAPRTSRTRSSRPRGRWPRSSAVTAPRRMCMAAPPNREPTPEPNPSPKPWPALKKGEIELAGVVESVAGDKRGLSLTLNSSSFRGRTGSRCRPRAQSRVLLRSKAGLALRGLACYPDRQEHRRRQADDRGRYRGGQAIGPPSQSRPRRV